MMHVHEIENKNMSVHYSKQSILLEMRAWWAELRMKFHLRNHFIFNNELVYYYPIIINYKYGWNMKPCSDSIIRKVNFFNSNI